MIYLDSCALIKFIKHEPETDALRAWRQNLDPATELLTSELSQLEITGQALSGVYLVDLTSMVLARARAYRLPHLGSPDAIHLASADPFRSDLSELVASRPAAIAMLAADRPQPPARRLWLARAAGHGRMRG